MKKLQQIFREINDDDSPIDLESDDLDIFCWSLRNQFLDLLGFERLDLPSMTSESTNDDQNEDITKNTITNQETIRAVALDKTILPVICNETETDIDGGAHIHIPDKYRRCVFCTKWKGYSSHVCKIKTGIYGICMMYNREQLSTDGTNCKDYEPKSTTPFYSR